MMRSRSKLLLSSAGMIAFAGLAAFGVMKGEQTAQSSGAVSLTLSARHEFSPGFENRAYSSETPGRLVIGNASLRDLVQQAYGLRDFQIAGGPDWINAHRYQVTLATRESPGIEGWKATVGPLLQTVLKSRFDLTLHQEMRQLPVYVLMVSPDGARLRRSMNETYNAHAGGPNTRLNHTFDATDIRLSGAADGSASLTDFFSGQLGRPVIDKTGMTGAFDVHLEWNREAMDGLLRSPVTNPEQPSIFKATEQELGLELKPGTGPVKVFVVDHAEKPLL